MTKRIYRAIVVVSMIILIACLVFIMGIMYEYYGSRVEADLKEKSNYISQGVENGGIDYLNSLDAGDSRITWISAEGTVLYDSDSNAEDMENHSDRQEFIQAVHDGHGEISRYSSTLSRKIHYYAVLLSDGSVLRVANSQYTVWVMLVSMLQPIAIIIIAALIISFLLASRLAKQIVKPLNELDLEHPEKDNGYEELSPLLSKIYSQNREIKAHISDIEQKQKEFTAITENMQEGFLVIDKLTNALSYNSAAIGLLGASVPSDGSPCSVLTLNRSENFRKVVEDALAGSHSEQIMRRAGRSYQLIANPVLQEDSVAGAVIIIMDITEKEQREELRREFTANVSHELKTPLTAVIGTAEIMQNGMVSPEDMPHFAGNIHKEASRLLNLVNDIIRLSQLDEDNVPQERSEVDLFEVAGAVTLRLADEAAEKEVEISLSGSHATVNGVEQIIDEMIFNLCDNAIKYNVKSGKVDINIKEDIDDVILTISDTGIGIPPEDRERVFERFYRVDKSHSKKNGGTGLGLSIVKHGAAFHGASITLESIVGSGTTVIITFPRNV